MKRVLQEALLVALFGAAFAFLANAVSPRGLHLTRDYENRKPLPAPNQVVKINGSGNTSGTNTNPPAATASNALAAELQSQGLQLASSNQVLQFFHDPSYAQGLIAFVDARHPEDYERGHIPGAHLLDYYHPESYLADLLPVCQTALQIVVYCNGGECTDSERTAIMLRDLGIPKERLYVYGGGITEWRANAWPIEVGARNSGQLLTPKK